MARMTIEEKAGQLNLMNDPFRWRPKGVNPGDRLDSDQAQTAEDIKAGRITIAITNASAKPATVWRVLLRGIVPEESLPFFNEVVDRSVREDTP